MPLDNPDLTQFTTASEAQAIYDYTDIADGTGVRVFFATATTDSASSQYILTKSTAPGGESGTGSSSTVAVLSGNVAELDFDLTAFNKPTTVKGTAVSSFTIYSAGTNALCKLQLKKWDGTSETNISSQITTKIYTTSAEILLSLPLTETHFSEGDVLRLSIDFDGTNINQGVGIDPSGAVLGAGVSTLQPFSINVPFKLDI